MSDVGSKNMHLICCACPPQLRLTKVTLHAQQMEQGTVKYKQLKLLEGGGESGRVRAPPINLCVQPKSSSLVGYGKDE